eukprot:9478532-Pyramimonas_sp.AAC.1
MAPRRAGKGRGTVRGGQVANAPLLIGNCSNPYLTRPFCNENFFGGRLDALRMWDKALSLEELALNRQRRQVRQSRVSRENIPGARANRTRRKRIYPGQAELRFS